MKAYYDQRPDVIQRIAPGQYLFNYNVTEHFDDEGQQQGYECDQVEIAGLPNYEVIVRKIIREKYNESEEFSIVNKYNAWQMGIGTADARSRYQDFLVEVNRIKDLVKNTLNMQ